MQHHLVMQLNLRKIVFGRRQPEAGRHHSFSKLPEIKGYEVFWVDTVVAVPQVGGLHHRYERRAA